MDPSNVQTKKKDPTTIRAVTNRVSLQLRRTIPTLTLALRITPHVIKHQRWQRLLARHRPQRLDRLGVQLARPGTASVAEAQARLAREAAGRAEAHAGGGGGLADVVRGGDGGLRDAGFAGQGRGGFGVEGGAGGAGGGFGGGGGVGRGGGVRGGGWDGGGVGGGSGCGAGCWVRARV